VEPGVGKVDLAFDADRPDDPEPAGGVDQPLEQSGLADARVALKEQSTASPVPSGIE
jgi:hypothetical protein